MAKEKTYYAQLLTPEGSLYDGDVLSVTVPGSSGSFQILYNHAPIVSSLGIGEIVIEIEDKSTIHYAVSGGFVELNNNKLAILAEKAEEASTIDRGEAITLRDELKKRVFSLREGREEAEIELKIAENRAKIAEI